MMLDFALNKNPVITRLALGNEQTPLLIIDNFALSPESLVTFAKDGASFLPDRDNFYPGKRKAAPDEYREHLGSLFLSYVKKAFALEAKIVETVVSALAISDLPPEQLRPIQMLPHFDSCASNQFAVVHYLCEREHGGTCFYRHRKTGFERISRSRLARYGAELKQEAIANRLHLNPAYMQGSNNMFEQIHLVEACMNRAIIYPSNLLHSGNINPAAGLSSAPEKGRLTLGSFIQIR